MKRRQLDPEKLRAKMTEKGMDAKGIDRATGVDRATIYVWLRGETLTPQPRTFAAVAKALGCKPEALELEATPDE